MSLNDLLVTLKLLKMDKTYLLNTNKSVNIHLYLIETILVQPNGPT